MPGHSVSFSELHLELLNKLAKGRHGEFSAIIKAIIDFALDHDPDLGLPLLTAERKAVQAELFTEQAKLTALDASIRELEAKAVKTPEKVFGVINSINNSQARATPKACSTDGRPGLTEEERWRVRVGYILNPSPNLPREDKEGVEQSVIENAKRHSDWLDRLPNEQQAALRGKMGSVLDPTFNLLNNDDKLRNRKSSETVTEEPVNSVNKTTAPNAPPIDKPSVQDDEDYAHFARLNGYVAKGIGSDRMKREILRISAKHPEWLRKVVNEDQGAPEVVSGGESL